MQKTGPQTAGAKTFNPRGLILPGGFLVDAALIRSLKGRRRISVLTCYDFSFARILDPAGIDVLLVGDSASMVVLGRPDTKSATMEEMLLFVSAVARGTSSSLVVADMPVNSYSSPKAALSNAQRFIAAGAKAVKVEGACPDVVRVLVSSEIPVMGHLGLTPQTAAQMKVQGKDAESAKKILDDALLLERAGCFSIVLECIPAPLAKQVTSSLKIPTIGIGAGPSCDGQVLVLHDVLGLYGGLSPKFAKKYADLSPIVAAAAKKFKAEVESGAFPDAEHSFGQVE